MTGMWVSRVTTGGGVNTTLILMQTTDAQIASLQIGQPFGREDTECDILVGTSWLTFKWWY